MVGRWIEGFETHQNNQQLARKYALWGGSFVSQAGRAFGTANGVNAMVAVTPSRGLADTHVIGFGLRLSANVTALNSNAQGLYLERGPNEQCHIEVVSSVSGFELRLMRGATEIDRTAEVFAFGAWHYFEISLTPHTSAGAFELRHNEVPVLTGSSLNLAASGSNQADIMAWRFVSNVSSQLGLDDIYWVDTTGSANNTFKGDSVVEGSLPNAAGASTQFTPSAGSNWQNVDDSGASNPTDTGTGGNNQSDTNGHKDLYGFADLTETQGTIHFIQVGTQLGMAAAGSRTVKTKYRDPDTTEADGASHVVSSTVYDEFTEIMDVNPTSSAAWDVADIDGGQFGLEVVS